MQASQVTLSLYIITQHAEAVCGDVGTRYGTFNFCHDPEPFVAERGFTSGNVNSRHTSHTFGEGSGPDAACYDVAGVMHVKVAIRFEEVQGCMNILLRHRIHGPHVKRRGVNQCSACPPLTVNCRQVGVIQHDGLRFQRSQQFVTVNEICNVCDGFRAKVCNAFAAQERINSKETVTVIVTRFHRVVHIYAHGGHRTIISVACNLEAHYSDCAGSCAGHNRNNECPCKRMSTKRVSCRNHVNICVSAVVTDDFLSRTQVCTPVTNIQELIFPAGISHINSYSTGCGNGRITVSQPYIVRITRSQTDKRIVLPVVPRNDHITNCAVPVTIFTNITLFLIGIECLAKINFR